MAKYVIEITRYLSRLLVTNEIGANDNLFALGYIDSLAAMQLITYLEKHYNICFDDVDIDYDNFKSIESIVELVKNKHAINNIEAG